MEQDKQLHLAVSFFLTTFLKATDLMDEPSAMLSVFSIGCVKEFVLDKAPDSGDLTANGMGILISIPFDK